MRKIPSTFFIGLFIATVSLSIRLITPSLVFAAPQEWGGTCVGSEVTSADPDDPNAAMAGVATIQGLECLVANIFAVFLTVLGLAGFIMMVIGSFRWLTSGGNTKGTETARNTFTFAVVGLVVALSAFIILRLLADFTGVQTILEFRIPNSNTRYD